MSAGREFEVSADSGGWVLMISPSTESVFQSSGALVRAADPIAILGIAAGLCEGHSIALRSSPPFGAVWILAMTLVA